MLARMEQRPDQTAGAKLRRWLGVIGSLVGGAIVILASYIVFRMNESPLTAPEVPDAARPPNARTILEELGDCDGFATPPPCHELTFETGDPPGESLNRAVTALTNRGWIDDMPGVIEVQGRWGAFVESPNRDVCISYEAWEPHTLHNASDLTRVEAQVYYCAQVGLGVPR